MGGKSTFLRQNALIAVMAQIGVYVPATSVTLGVVDQLFSRVRLGRGGRIGRGVIGRAPGAGGSGGHVGHVVEVAT